MKTLIKLHTYVRAKGSNPTQIILPLAIVLIVRTFDVLGVQGLYAINYLRHNMLNILQIRQDAKIESLLYVLLRSRIIHYWHSGLNALEKETKKTIIIWAYLLGIAYTYFTKFTKRILNYQRNKQYNRGKFTFTLHRAKNTLLQNIKYFLIPPKLAILMEKWVWEFSNADIQI